MAIITAFEYQRLRISEPGEGGLTKAHVDALHAAQDRLPKGAIHFHRNAVSLGNFCGLVQVGNDTLEVLPKIYREVDDPSAHRALLVEMLTVFDDLQLSRSGAAQVSVTKQPLLHVFVTAFCDELTRQLRSGLIRQYSQQEETLPLWRGTIDWTTQLRERPTQFHRLACRFEEFTHDNAYNQVIAATLKVLQNAMSGHQLLAERLNSLSLYFDGVSPRQCTGANVRSLPRTRLMTRFADVLRWCEWFLDRLSPELYSGSSPVFSLLFDMNVLFEGYVFRLAKRAARQLPDPRRLLIQAERPVRWLLREQNSAGTKRFGLKPDITVTDRNTGDVVAILDTKWKRLDPNGRYSYWGVGQADVYQMLAYSQAYDCQQLMLLYPLHEGLEGLDSPSFTYELPASVRQPDLNLGLVDLGAGGGLAVRRQVLLQLEGWLGSWVADPPRAVGGFLR